MNSLKILFLLSFGFFLFSHKSYCQDSTSLQYAIRYSYNYNCKIIHHCPSLSLEYANHNVYIGPAYSQIIKPLGEPEDGYAKNTWGINLGYRYYFCHPQKIKLFGQLNFSFYYYSYQQTQLGPHTTKRSKFIVENTDTLGIDYSLYKKIHLFAGFGIGSPHGFFLILDSVFPSSFAGIDFKF